ncbi:hypothetical protein BMF94_3074 [Rhodotorula taiwanensis]|uniref:SURP motif domain-containing protein n=1 Tax=Rhodotorula taiwanensis TaxID=741276 RepID=A0A2S5BAW3_9BASI|nr:hypothetical protein BMF94_3074 [Rhodotorula taiwanensis]
MSTKRPRRRQSTSPDRSPSPTLPAHLYSSLPFASTSSASATALANRDPALAHLALHMIEAREATLLDPLEWPEASRGSQVEWTGWVDGDDDGDDGGGEQQQQKHVWTDRYDLLHFLSSIPPIPRLAPPDPAQMATQSSGFDDLPSDHEEMFFLNSRADRAEVERKKKRRRLEEERERRVRERMKEDGDEAEDLGASEGDEPPKEIHLLMSRLHTTLSRSPNPALLELRILANHGSDVRFASFLKRDGKWREAWETMRRGQGPGHGQGSGQVVAEVGDGPDKEREEKNPTTTGLGGLADYGSDSDDGTESADAGHSSVASPAPVPSTLAADTPTAAAPPAEVPAADSSVPTSGDRASIDGLTEEQRLRQAARAAKAREWAQRRREARNPGEAGP